MAMSVGVLDADPETGEASMSWYLDMVQDGHPGENQYGLNPKEVAAGPGVGAPPPLA